ncbi:MAG: DNRLRE domain-containing protein, partial [Bacteroidales bacterium]|nr:DNRLRE domain-containing protein [Bacteroidales bacterium]
MKNLILNQHRRFFRFLFSILIFANFVNIKLVQGFESITNLNSFSVSANTGEKPQSKVWTHNDIWWAVLPNSSGTHLWRLDGILWTNVLTLSSTTNSYSDCKVDGDVTHILLYSGTSSELVSIEYLVGSNTYQLWSQRPSTVSISLDSGVETATIDIDETGRMWLASDVSSDINVRWSDSPYSTWSSPITIASGIGSDDICCIATFDGKTGVLWSNQNTDRFGFKYHVDGTDPNTWSTDEVPASQSAISVGGGMADDHLNMAVASDGTIYAAVKTSYDTGGYPKIALLVRRPAGTWDDLYEVDQSGTRGIVLLNETSGKIVVTYTASESGGNIIYKESPISAISFGPSAILISGSNNNVTSTKQNYNDEFVAFASDGSNTASVLVSETVIAEDLVGHWAMEENDGVTILTDSSAFGNNGNVTGSLVQELGQRAYGQDFDGSNDYVFVPDDASLDIMDEITIAVWIKPTKVGTQRIIRKLNTTTNNGYSLFLSANNYFSIRFNGSNSLRVNTSALYSSYLNQWIHIAVTYDGTTIRTYFNGNPDNTLTTPFTIGTNNLDLCLGARAEDGGDKFEGGMDDVRIFNYALSPTEILSLQSTWDPPNPDNLVGHWAMEEGSGSNLVDSSSYNNDGTITGSPVWVEGKDGLALALDGTNDFATVPYDPSLDITNAITLAAWIRPGKTGTQRIIRKVDGVAGTGYSLFLSSVGYVSVRFNNSNSYRVNTIAFYPTSGTEWMHVAATYDGSKIRTFINGEPDDSLAVAFTILTNTENLSIGAETEGGNKFQGAIDDARIYNKALSIAEIQSLPGLSVNLPNDPSNLEANSVSGTEINLTWIDSSSDESNFVIERSETGYGGPFNFLISLPANSTAYTDTGLDQQTEYCYRVKATNVAGSSGYTNTDCATTTNEPVSVIFQQGLNGYAGAIDTYIWGGSFGDNSYGTDEMIQWDGDSQGAEQDGLIRFENIFGTELNQIPEGATILSAFLTYMIFDTGDEADLYEISTDWTENITWNTFGINPGVQAGEDYGSLVGTTTGSDSNGSKDVDVTTSLINWAVDPIANKGWIFRPTGNSGVDFRSSDYNSTPEDRPKLTVLYTITIGGVPDDPVLIAPTNGSIENSTSPELIVSVSDPDSDNMTVSFYGREKNTKGENFTVVGGASFYNQYDMSAGDFELIGTNTEVVSGSNTSMIWPDLAPATEYEWYVTVNDGNNSITGDLWTFTTSSGSPQYSINITIDGNGTVTKYPDQPLYDPDDIVALEAFPADDWSFVEWQGDHSGSINPDNIIVTDNMDITAVFDSTSNLPGPGKALDFDGINDYVNCGNSTVFDMTTAITIEAWIRPNILGTLSILKKNFNNTGYELYCSAYAPGSVYARINENNTYRAIATTPYPKDGLTWMHAAFTFDGTDMKIYINGILEHTVPGVNILTNSADLIIGSDTENPGNLKNYIGHLDEIRLWNVARTQTEIRESMCKKLTGSELALVGYWRLDESSGTLVEDATNYGNYGTMVNMAENDHVWSGAALGDDVDFDYDASGGFAAMISHADGDFIQATTTSGTVSGIQVYRTDATSLRYGATGPFGWDMDNNRYWGVFVAGANPEYTLIYNYNGNPMVLVEDDLKLTIRRDHADDTWYDAGAYLNTVDNTLTLINQTGTEFALASGLDIPETPGALNFDGSDDYVQVPDSPGLDITNAITLEAWVYPNVEDTQYLIKKAIQEVTDGYELSLSSPSSSAGEKRFFVRFNQSSSGNTFRLNSLTQYQTGIWTHVAATYDGDTIRIYLNGIEDNSMPASILINTNDLILGIGAQSNGTVNFNGQMDEVRIWDAARTIDEIRYDMYREIPDPLLETNLVAYFRFNEGSGQLVTDETLNGNNGILGSTSGNDTNDPLWISSTAAVPYYSVQGGDYNSDNVWATGQNAPVNFWSRVTINHNVAVISNPSAISAVIDPLGELTIGSGFNFTIGETLEINGTFYLTENSTLQLESGGEICIKSGGELQAIGSSGNEAKITHVTGYYSLLVEEGGVLGAENTVFEYMNINGVIIAGIIDIALPLRNCTFQNGEPGGALLNFTGSQSITLESVQFPTNTWTGNYNVTKSVDAGRINFIQDSGGFTGEDYENDLYNRINWDGIPMEIKVFLEGPYNGTEMNSNLTSILPLSQPYDTPPWNYSGTENVASIPGDVVDWILVEFRDAPNAASATLLTSIATQAAFVNNNGEV